MNLIKSYTKSNTYKTSTNRTKTSILKKTFLLSLTSLVLIMSYIMYGKTQKATASPFGLGNDYAHIISINEQALEIMPVSIESISIDQTKGDARVIALLTFLKKRGSPMATFSIAKAFVDSADKYGFSDKWYLLPAIAGIESSFGRFIPYDGNKPSYNAWGWSGGSAKSRWSFFASWEDAADKVSRGIAKGYGSTNLDPNRMMASYCPPCAASGGAWARHVNMYANELKTLHNSLK